MENSKIDLTNKELLAATQAKITKIEFKLNGIIKKKNRKTGEIIIEKVGELFLQESLVIEFEKMKERLGILEKTLRNCEK